MYRVSEEIENELLSKPASKLSYNKKEMLMRCPFCGDSRKNSSHTHLYLKVENEEERSPFPYYCQRCKTTGILDKDFLKQLDIHDSDLFIEITKHNKTIKRTKKKITLNNKFDLKIPKIRNTKRNRIKLDYINKRLGLNMSFADLEKYKVVFSIYDLLDLNEMEKITCSEKMLESLNKNFIGFVSYDNSHIIMRNLSTKSLPEVRYYNYNIFDDPTGSRFYIVPNRIDLLSPTINIIAAEGVFDIMGVKEHIFSNEMDTNTIFTAICGTGFQNVIMKFAKLGFLEMNIHIFSDADQGIKSYNQIKKQLDKFTKGKIKISYNRLGKDYGVPKDKISLKNGYL